MFLRPRLAEYTHVDLIGILALWRLCDLVGKDTDAAKDIDSCLKNPASALIVAKLDTYLVGSVMLSHDIYHGQIYYLCVHPDYQKQGIGREMLSYAEQWMNRRRLKKIQAMIRPDNLLVRGFYRRLGYKDINVEIVEKLLDRSLDT